MFLPYLKDQESSFIDITGGAGAKVLSPKSAIVTVGAAALYGLSLGLRKEYEASKVRVHELRIGMFVGRDEEKGKKHSNFEIGRFASKIASTPHTEHLIRLYKQEDFEAL